VEKNPNYAVDHLRGRVFVAQKKSLRGYAL